MALDGTTGTALTPSTAATNGVPGSTSKSAQTDPLLDKNAFLKLMMTQLKDQDPLNPSDPSQYIGQLAQLTSVEQETNIAQSSSQTASAQSANTALGLLGHTVSYTDANGVTHSGAVQKVEFTSSGPSLTIAGASGINPSAVTEVS